MKIIELGDLPPEDPMFSEGLQVFTTPYSGASPDRAIEKVSEETREPEETASALEVPEPDWETAESNFDKLMDAYELGGMEALGERFMEQLRQQRSDKDAEK